jgi:receptor protein-tyrosine kinase
MPAAKDENSSGYFSSANIGNMFAELRNSYDYILVDTPPCGLISDALFIAQHADAAIFVMYQDAVRISRIRNTMDSLMTTDIRILGAVLNGTAQGISGYGYGYGYGGYGYGYGYGKYGYGKYGYGYGKYGYGYGYGENHKHKKHKHRRSSKRSEKSETTETKE